MYALEYGKLSLEYEKLLDACSKKGIYGFSKNEVLGIKKWEGGDKFCRETYGKNFVAGEKRGGCIMKEKLIF